MAFESKTPNFIVSKLVTWLTCGWCGQVCYFLYKNLLFGLTIFFFNGMCFFSGQILYNGMLQILMLIRLADWTATHTRNAVAGACEEALAAVASSLTPAVPTTVCAIQSSTFQQSCHCCPRCSSLICLPHAV